MGTLHELPTGRRDRLLTKREVADHFKVSTRTVERWVADRGLPSRPYTAGTVRFSSAEVDRWAAAQPAYGGVGRAGAWATRAAVAAVGVDPSTFG